MVKIFLFIKMIVVCLLVATMISCAKETMMHDAPNEEKEKPVIDTLEGQDSVIRILAIGNSFSMDATEHHLRELANAEGVQLQVANLYISGATLQMHWDNAVHDSAAYDYRKMDEVGLIEVTSAFKLADALADEEWNYISFQQASGFSGQFETYIEPLPLLFDYVATRVSDRTMFVFHQTWAYAQDATNTNFVKYNNDQMVMYNAIISAASQAYDLVNFDGIIPVGTAIQNGRTSLVGDYFTRDGYHLDDEMGKYTAACTWFEAIFQQSVVGNTYRPVQLSTYEAEIAQHAAHAAVINPYTVTPLEGYEGGHDGILLHPILIDFGRNTPALGWNQITSSLATSSIFNLVDESGTETGVSLRILERFNGGNANGALTTNIAGFDIPSSVSSDSFFGNANTAWQGTTIPQSVVKIWGLDKELEYCFCFFGSRTGVSDNRETVYEVTGNTNSSVLLQTSNNTQSIACIDDVRPNESGEAFIRISKGGNNNNEYGFFYLNAMRISNAQ